jgi:hypothetical protein
MTFGQADDLVYRVCYIRRIPGPHTLTQREGVYRDLILR